METKAPVGYVLPTNPYTAITLNDDTKIGLVYTSTITNMEQQGNQLPLTGGAGVASRKSDRPGSRADQLT
ncbi:hypothetical protein AADG42_13195 [Ammonicoccus fulvus]|uniref:Uncharacterized protein n=1 Tax=Ammonicoccus fulvus TaxID=3138240 RepID=A0ABZ3FQ81_9ACTN